VDNPWGGENERPLIFVLQRGNFSQSFNPIHYAYESLFYEAMVSFDEGRQIKKVEDHDEEFQKILHKKMRATDGSKMRTGNS
jgi:hypothetical protein